MKDKFNIIRMSEVDELERMIYYEELYKFLSVLRFEYPGFGKWYKNLYIDEKLKPSREVLMCVKDNRILGATILKDDEEKKICTIRVDRKYQRNGIGKELIENSLEILNTEKPLITVAKNKIEEFDKLFEYYGFKLEQENRNYYKLLKTELVFNGNLKESNFLLQSLIITDISDFIKRCIENNVNITSNRIADYAYYLYERKLFV